MVFLRDIMSQDLIKSCDKSFYVHGTPIGVATKIANKSTNDYTRGIAKTINLSGFDNFLFEEGTTLRFNKSELYSICAVEVIHQDKSFRHIADLLGYSFLQLKALVLGHRGDRGISEVIPFYHDSSYSLCEHNASFFGLEIADFQDS